VDKARRDAMIEQGSLLNTAVDDGLVLKEFVATSATLTISQARARMAVATKLNDEIHDLLDDREQIFVSFDALTTLLNDDDPMQLLIDLFIEAEKLGKKRVSRDAVRRMRGNAPGTVGSIEATAARMLMDPAYAKSVAEELSKTEDGRRRLAELFAILEQALANMAEPRAKGTPQVKGFAFVMHQDSEGTKRLSDALTDAQPINPHFRGLLLEHIGNQRRRYDLIEAQVTGHGIDNELDVLLGGGQ
jgi:hypothetical protein